MVIEIKAPQFPESVADGSIATWHKQPGEFVARDEIIVDIETDKVVLEVVAPEDGNLTEIFKHEGDTVLSLEVIAAFVAGSAAVEVVSTSSGAPVSSPAAANAAEATPMSPSARKLASQSALTQEDIVGTGKGAGMSVAVVHFLYLFCSCQSPSSSSTFLSMVLSPCYHEQFLPILSSPLKPCRA